MYSSEAPVRPRQRNASMISECGGGDAAPNVTALSVLVEATFPLENASMAAPALTVAITVPDPDMPLTATLYVVPLPVTTAVVAPAVPLSVTPPLVKPVTAALNTTVKLIGDARV